jgi:Rho termination factor, N-terminal domain
MLLRRYHKKEEQSNEVAPDYDAMKVPELKDAAKEKGIEGYNHMLRDDLLKALKGDDNDDEKESNDEEAAE